MKSEIARVLGAQISLRKRGKARTTHRDRLLCQLVEVEVEFKDVDAGLAENAELTARGVLRDELADAVFRDAAGFGDAGNLEIGGVGGDVRVEAGAGGGDQVDGNGLAGVLFGELVDGALDAVNKSFVGLGQVGAAGGCGIVAIAGGRWAGMEVSIRGEALGKQR